MDPLLRRADKAIISTRGTVGEARGVRPRLNRNCALLDASARRRREELDRIRRRYACLLAVARIACGAVQPESASARQH